MAIYRENARQKLTMQESSHEKQIFKNYTEMKKN